MYGSSTACARSHPTDELDFVRYASMPTVAVRVEQHIALPDRNLKDSCVFGFSIGKANHRFGVIGSSSVTQVAPKRGAEKETKTSETLFSRNLIKRKKLQIFKKMLRKLSLQWPKDICSIKKQRLCWCIESLEVFFILAIL